MTQAVAADLGADHALDIRSVLIVDDHPLYCDALAATMQSFFHTRRIRTADTLEKAMQHLKSRYSPDLVLLDLNLPDVSGLSGFLKIKKKAPEVPVIVISAISDDAIVEQVMSAGAQPSVTSALAKRAPSMWTPRPESWAMRERAASSSSE